MALNIQDVAAASITQGAGTKLGRDWHQLTAFKTSIETQDGQSDPEA